MKYLLAVFCLALAALIASAEWCGMRSAPHYTSNPPASSYNYEGWNYRITPTGVVAFCWVGYADLSLVWDQSAKHKPWSVELAEAGPLHDRTYDARFPLTPFEPSIFQEWNRACVTFPPNLGYLPRGRSLFE